MRDGDLILLARQGDEGAHEALLARWRPLLERLARRYHGKAEYEDAMSAAYAGYLEAVRTFDPTRGEWKHWLSQKVVSLIRDESVKAEGQRVLEAGDVLDFEPAAPSDAESRAVLRAFLKTLTFEDRRILALSARGYSARQIAKRLKTNHDNVARRLLLVRARYFLFTGDWR